MTEQDIQDAILRHALELQRLSAHEEGKAERILRDLENELRALLNSRVLTGLQRKELEELIAAAEEAITARYEIVAKGLDTRSLVLIVAERTVEAMEDIGDIALPTRETLESLSDDLLIEGNPLSDWWDAQRDDTQRKFAGAVRQGVVNGETNEKIVARIAGPNGFMEVSRRHARTLVHSSIMSAANQARLATYRKNMKHAAGLKWLATLDSHTCVTCGALDGATWDFEGKPIRGTRLDFQTPPNHPNCRCVITPLPISFDDIFGQRGLDETLANMGARASSEGPVRSGTTFTEFLKRQSPAFVENALGTKRAEMFLANKLSLKDLVSGSGRPLTLDELKAR